MITDKQMNIVGEYAISIIAGMVAYFLQPFLNFWVTIGIAVMVGTGMYFVDRWVIRPIIRYWSSHD